MAKSSSRETETAVNKKTSPTPPPIPNSDEAPPDGELARVREIILGPDQAQQRLRGAEVDRLRQVIFGAQMEEYDRRFADFRRDMDRMLTDLRLVQDSVSDFEKTITKRLEALERDIRRSNDELRREMERLSSREASLQQLMTRTQQQELFGQGLTERINELHNKEAQFDREITSLRNAFSENREQEARKLDTLKREVRQAEDSLRAELRRVTDRLSDQKTDRKALAAMLMEVATRLETGSSVTGLLEGLSTATK